MSFGSTCGKKRWSRLVEVWQVSLAARLVITTAFAWIAALIARNLFQGQQWTANPVGVAAFLVFTSATLRSIGYSIHAFGWPWDRPELRDTARTLLGSPLAATWAIVAALVLLLYLLPRARRGARDAARLVAWDLRREQREALRLQQGVQMRLLGATAAFESGDTQACRALLDEALDASRCIVADLLPSRPKAGRLRAQGGRHG